MGSPPHVRGIGFCFVFYRVSHGITPACAGNRVRAPDVVAVTGDHPRMCGE